MLASALLGAIALLGFMLIARSVDAHATGAFDETLQRWTLAHQRSATQGLFRWITMLGGITGMRVVTVLGAGYLAYRGRGRAGVAVLFVPYVADLLFHLAKRAYTRARPLGLGEGVDASYAFPSGHATVSAAVCATLAYVSFREGLIKGEAAVAIAVLVPLLVGISRVYLNVHWATDVVAGWCAGLVVAATWMMLYASLRGRVA